MSSITTKTTYQKITVRISDFITYFWKHRIRKVLLTGILIYIGLVLIFGFIFWISESLVINSCTSKLPNFLESVYFSCVTFLTIGYGDIIPKTEFGRFLVFTQSCLALLFTPIFGGFLTYKFLQRPKDTFLTDNFFVRHINNHIFLSTRLGNKGFEIIDCTATVEFITIVNNVKRTLYKREFNSPLVETTWFFDVKLDGIENQITLNHFKTLLANPTSSLIRVTVIGTDANSGNIIHAFKYYEMDKLKFGGGFSNVYNWQGVRRTIPNWKNFNSVSQITSEQKQLIDNLLQ